MSTPNPALALAHYRALAPRYDEATWMMEPLRRRAIDRLRLLPGDTVLDVACGTGKSFALIEEQIGPQGRLIGIDQSPDMLAIARARVERAGWRNVQLVESAVERAELPGRADAALFVYAHDVLQSAAALDRLFAQLRPGAHVASAGMKFFPWWLAPLNLLVLAKARGYATALAGFRRPWRRLEHYAGRLAVEPLYGGLAYVAHDAHGR
jgi:demethylmenaquinone methyltransferase/2-methoxy-6-polyprenyl-1,4-benzoquinol methylase